MAGYGRPVVNRFDRLNYIRQDAPDFKQYVNPEEEETLNSLGAAKKRRHRRNKAKTVAALKAALAKLPPEEAAKKLAAMKAARAARRSKRAKLRLAARMAKKALALKKLKAAVKANPNVKKALARKWLARGLRRVADEVSTSSPVPQLRQPASAPAEDPKNPAVEETVNPSEAEQVEQMQDESAENAYQADEEVYEEATEEATEEVVDEEAEENADLSEPSPDETADEDAAAGVGDDTEMGKKMARARKVAHRTKVLTAAKPHAKRLEKKSKGKVNAKKTLKGCALLQAARGGDKKSKAAVKALQLSAKKGNKKAKAAVAQLRLCSKVLKTARKAVRGTPTGPGPGLNSSSATQRGYAMIPTTAARMFRR